MLIGDVGRNTRSMLRNRDGRPRSLTSSAALAAAPTALIHRIFRTNGRSDSSPDSCAAAATTPAQPVTPPT